MKDLYLVIKEDVDLNNLTKEQEQALMYCLLKAYIMLTEAEKEEQIVFNETDYFEKVDSELHNKIEWIIPNAQKNMMEPIRLTLDPGGTTYPDNPHDGEEFGYVLAGSIYIYLGNKRYKARKGETFYFKANTTHYIQANAKTGATLLWVSTPPSF